MRPTDQEVTVTEDRVYYTHRKVHAMATWGNTRLGWRLGERGKLDKSSQFVVMDLTFLNLKFLIYEMRIKTVPT